MDWAGDRGRREREQEREGEDSSVAEKKERKLTGARNTGYGDHYLGVQCQLYLSAGRK